MLVPDPMLLMIRLELGSTGSLEISRFQGLSSGKQRWPPSVALAPRAAMPVAMASPLEAPELDLGVIARAARSEAATTYEGAGFMRVLLHWERDQPRQEPG